MCFDMETAGTTVGLQSGASGASGNVTDIDVDPRATAHTAHIVQRRVADADAADIGRGGSEVGGDSGAQCAGGAAKKQLPHHGRRHQTSAHFHGPGGGGDIRHTGRARRVTEASGHRSSNMTLDIDHRTSIVEHRTWHHFPKREKTKKRKIVN